MQYSCVCIFCLCLKVGKFGGVYTCYFLFGRQIAAMNVIIFGDYLIWQLRCKLLDFTTVHYMLFRIFHRPNLAIVYSKKSLCIYLYLFVEKANTDIDENKKEFWAFVGRKTKGKINISPH